MIEFLLSVMFLDHLGDFVFLLNFENSNNLLIVNLESFYRLFNFLIKNIYRGGIMLFKLSVLSYNDKLHTSPTIGHIWKFGEQC